MKIKLTWERLRRAVSFKHLEMCSVRYSKSGKATDCVSDCAQISLVCPVPTVSLVCFIVTSLAPFKDFHTLASFHPSVHRQHTALARKTPVAGIAVTGCSFDDLYLFEPWSKVSLTQTTVVQWKLQTYLLGL